VDLVSESEREEIAAFIGKELRREFGLDFLIIPFSVHAVYEHLKIALDRDLLHPLMVPLMKARDTLSRAVQGFRDRLAGNINRALGIQFQVEPFGIDLQMPALPDVAISNLFMFNTDLLWFVIPMGIFRSWADGHFLNRIPFETEKNLSRLASQWTESINAAILKIQRNAERNVRDQLSTVESLLSRTQSEAEEIRIALLEVESFGKAMSS
jgi:hypothetical protein